MDNKISENEALAHSARKTVAAQTYKTHIENVTAIATENAQRAAKYYSGDKELFVETVNAGAFFHDLGKLDYDNQAVLMRNSKEALPINHVDAGTSHLLKLGRLESSVLAYSHHIGLPNFFEHFSNGEKAFRDPNIFDRTNQTLDEYIKKHRDILGSSYSSVELKKALWTGLTRRIALSCLVDGDHTDTATHYGNEVICEPKDLKAKDRLIALDSYVAGLANDW